MKSNTFLWFGIVALAIAGCSVEETGQTADTDEGCEAMFVQEAESMSFDGDTLTLKQASPNIIWFCDRPDRQAGHMTWDALIEVGASGEDSFAENEPNVAVSVIGSDGEVTETIVALTRKPEMSGTDPVFFVKMLEGELPDTAGETVLYRSDRNARVANLGSWCTPPTPS